jgi:hypothetical protein
MLNQVGISARVIGDAFDEVGVMLDTIEYRMGVRSKGPIVVNGEAHDEVKAVSENKTVDAVFDTLGDGFYRMMLPDVEGSPRVKATNLALARVAPLQSSACDIHSDVTYRLPKGYKLLGGGVNYSADFEGVGKVDVMVKQSGKNVRVVRNLKLEQTIVPVSDYDKYRQLIVTWQGVSNLLFRAK